MYYQPYDTSIGSKLCIYIYIYIYTHVCIYIYIYTYTLNIAMNVIVIINSIFKYTHMYEDVFIADLSVGLRAGQIKTGAPHCSLI